MAGETVETVPTSEEQLFWYRFVVKMTCGGCSGAVSRVLTRLKEAGEVSEFTVSLETQEVFVKGKISYDELLGKIQKTGKQVISGEVLKAEEDAEDEANKAPEEGAKAHVAEAAKAAQPIEQGVAVDPLDPGRGAT